MKEQLITFETAKLTKEKGWTTNYLSTLDYYKTDGIKAKLEDLTKNRDYKNFYFHAPTQSLLQKWLREVHKFEIQIFTMGVYMNKLTNPHSEFKNSIGFKTYCYGLNADYGKDDRGFKTYEEALEKGLQEALKLIS